MIRATTQLLTARAMASMALAPAASAEPGRDGQSNLLPWQAPSMLNVDLETGTKDMPAASLGLEPLAVLDPGGALVPRLAAEDRSLITWTPRPDLTWFDGPRPNPLNAFAGRHSPIHQQAQFKTCTGAQAPTCTEANVGPVGTGPFRATEFRTHDMATFAASPGSREADKALPDEAGWTVGGDGIREKDSRRLSLLCLTSVNAMRQDLQAPIKQWWPEIGIGTGLKAGDAGVVLGNDPGSPDTISTHYADVQMHGRVYDGVDPESYLAKMTCAKIPDPDDQWQGQNTARHCDKTYAARQNRLADARTPAAPMGPASRLNDRITRDGMAIIPRASRARVSARSLSPDGVQMHVRDSEFPSLADGSRAAR